MSLSYEDMLRQAIGNQRANDAANRELKKEKERSEYEQKKRLIDQHKKLSHRSNGKQMEKKPDKPAHLSDMLSSYRIPKKNVDNGENSSSSHHRQLGTISNNASKNGISSSSIQPSNSSSSQKDISRSSHTRPSTYSSATIMSSSNRLLSTSLSQKPGSSYQSNGKPISSALSRSGTSISKSTSNIPNSSIASKPSTNGNTSSGSNLFDILSGAKHKTSLPPKPTPSSSKPKVLPPAPSKPLPTTHLSSKTSQSKVSSKGPSTHLTGHLPSKAPSTYSSSHGSSKGLSTQTNSRSKSSHPASIKPGLKPVPPVRRPPPASFEEMLKLAKTNLEKKDEPTQPPPFKPKLPRDPPPSVKDIKKSQMAASSSKLSSQRDVKPPGSTKPSSSDLKRPIIGGLRSLPSSTSERMKSSVPDRSKQIADARIRNPERFRNDNRNFQSSTNRPAPAAKKPFDPLARDRFMPLPTSKNNYRPPGYDRYSVPPKRPRYEDDYYDDEDDSMDDFIDDDEAEDYNGELKKVLKGFCRSDESTWRRREQEIDLSKMNARFHDIDAEERRSYRIARMEDLLEEERGSKAL